MKKIIINIVLAVTTVFALSACEDFLDTKNLTQKTTENFPETEKDAQEMVTAIYAHLLFESPETSSQFYVAQLAGDDCLGGNLSYSGNCATNFLLYKDNLNGLLSLWDRDYTLINRANSALASFGNVKSWSSEEEMNRLIGETYFLRAFAYNELGYRYATSYHRWQLYAGIAIVSLLILWIVYILIVRAYRVKHREERLAKKAEKKNEKI